MLKPISRLRSICKGDLNHNTNPHLLLLSIRQKQYVGRNILYFIPVLSIFALFGIITYATTCLPLTELSNTEVYAADSTSNTSSLIIDNGTTTDSTATVRTGVTYSSHEVKVSASNITGYTLSITGPTTLSNNGTTINGAGGKTGSAMNDNTWGYGWNTTSTADANMTYNSFSGGAQNLSGDSVSNNAVSFTRKLVFAAKFGDNAASGHYKANVKLNLTVTPKTVTTYNYSVTYNLNGGSGTAPVQQASSDSSSYIFYAPSGDSLTKSGHRFLGWSTSSTATKPTYEIGSAISLTSSSNAKTLYAVWQELTLGTILYMQEMSPSICANASIGAERILMDVRGPGPYEAYTVRKLADGNCWMVDNLRLDLSIQGIATVDASDNLSEDYPSAALTDRWVAASGTAANKWQDNKAVAQFSKEPQKIYSGSYQVGSGYFYSFKAATAETIADDATSGSATGSICPKGWHLPTSGSSSGFQALINIYNNNQVSSNSHILLGAKTEAGGGAYFLAAGFVDSSGLNSAGSYGYYWSDAVIGSDCAYRLYFASSTIHADNTSPTSSTYKYKGYPVRCIAYSS